MPRTPWSPPATGHSFPDRLILGWEKEQLGGFRHFEINAQADFLKSILELDRFNLLAVHRDGSDNAPSIDPRGLLLDGALAEDALSSE